MPSFNKSNLAQKGDCLERVDGDSCADLHECLLQSVADLGRSSSPVSPIGRNLESSGVTCGVAIWLDSP